MKNFFNKRVNTNNMINKLTNNINHHKYFSYDNDTEIVIPITANCLNDLMQPIVFNDMHLISSDLYTVLINHYNHIPTTCKTTLAITIKENITNQQKQQFAEALKIGFISSSLRALAKKNKQIKHSIYVLILFIISLILITCLEILLVWLQETTNNNKALDIFIKMVNEIMFIVMWVLGWSFCDIVFFELTKLNQKISVRYKIYKSKITFKKSKTPHQATNNKEKNN